MTRRTGHKRAKRVTHDPKPTVRFRAYEILSRAVADGIAYGWGRAYKYESDPIPEEGPRACEARDAIESAVMNAICEVMEFAPFEEQAN